MSDAVVRFSYRSIREGSRSFAVASRLFAPSIRESAWMLYAWCRHCDDVVDGQDLGRGAPSGDVSSSGERLERIRRMTREALGDGPVDAPAFVALRRVVRRHDIPGRHPMELIEGFAMDVERRRFEELEDTLRYAYHVAGVVGVMMARVLGVRDADTLSRAADLGIAMQLTNIARDVIDDAGAGRVYLPLRWLREAGIPPSEVGEPARRRDVSVVVGRLLGIAERHYRSGDVGIRRLDPRSAWAVGTARGVYRDIGRIVSRRGEHAWDRRAVVGTARKLYRVIEAGLGALLRTGAGGRPADDRREGVSRS